MRLVGDSTHILWSTISLRYITAVIHWSVPGLNTDRSPTAIDKSRQLSTAAELRQTRCRAKPDCSTPGYPPSRLLTVVNKRVLRLGNVDIARFQWRLTFNNVAGTLCTLHLKLFISPEWIYPIAKQTENNKLSNLTINTNSQNIQHDDVGNT